MHKTALSLAAFAALAACGGGTDETVVAETEDGTVTATRDSDGTVTYRTEDGEATITSGESTASAGDLPEYPGAETQGGFSVNASGEDGGSGQMTTFTTNDAPAEVIAFYRRALESRGYTIQAAMDMGNSQTLIGERGEGTGIHVSATETPGQNNTTVTIIAGQDG